MRWLSQIKADSKIVIIDNEKIVELKENLSKDCIIVLKNADESSIKKIKNLLINNLYPRDKSVSIDE
jgi:uncharacterized protein YbcI